MIDGKGTCFICRRIYSCSGIGGCVVAALIVVGGSVYMHVQHGNIIRC